MSINVDETLEERSSRYGDFAEGAKTAQAIKAAMSLGNNWNSLQPYMKEALERMTMKIERILTGDPAYQDNWHDIAGYAILVEKELQKRDPRLEVEREKDDEVPF